MKLIDKDTLVAEIERILSAFENSDAPVDRLRASILIRLLSFIDTLEVEEVDLDKEMDKEWNKCEPIDEGMGLEIASIEHEQFDNIAKHFFRLGMAVSNES